MHTFNIVSLFEQAAARHPEKTAIIQGDSTVSFGDLASQIRDTAAWLQSKGIVKGDRVLVFVPMSTDLYRIVLALFKIGATAVFLDEWVSRERLEACCRVAPCKAWIGGWKVHLLALTSKELRRMPVKLGLNYRTGLPLNETPTQDTDTALVTFTTGSTGIPKAALRTHGFLLAQFNALSEIIVPDTNDVDMPVLPIVLMINLGIGCTSVIAPYKSSKPHTLKPQQIAGLLVQHGVTRMVASPYFVKQVAQYAKQQALHIPGLKKIFTGGAPVFPQEAGLYVEAFPEADIRIVFGSTEAEPISAIDARVLAGENCESTGGLPVGMPESVATVRIIRMIDAPVSCDVPAELEALFLPHGEIGEIIVSGPHVLSAYVNNPEALLRNKIRIGETCWHRTGDSGFLDAEGQLFLTGRCNSLIVHNDRLIATFLVEYQLQAMDEIEIGTLLSVNDQMIIVIELRKGVLSQPALFVKLKTTFPYADHVAEIKRMPRDPRHHSKIDYAKLRQIYLKGNGER